MTAFEEKVAPLTASSWISEASCGVLPRSLVKMGLSCTFLK